MISEKSHSRIRRLLVLVPLLSLAALPWSEAWGQTTPEQVTTSVSPTSSAAPTSAPTSSVRPTVTVPRSSTIPQTSIPRSTVTTAKRPVTTTTARRPSTTVPLTTAVPTTPSTVPTSTEPPTTPTTAATTTTSVAPVKEADPVPASGGRLPLVVGGLLGVGVAIAALTFLFWRHTRPGYDDYYPYDDNFDESLDETDNLAAVTTVDGGLTVGRAGAAVGVEGTRVLAGSAYPPDDAATVVVKPLSELQGSGSDAVAGISTPDPGQERTVGRSGADGGADSTAGAVGLAALAARPTDDSSEDTPAGSGVDSPRLAGGERQTLSGVETSSPAGSFEFSDDADPDTTAEPSRFVRSPLVPDDERAEDERDGLLFDDHPSVVAFVDGSSIEEVPTDQGPHAGQSGHDDLIAPGEDDGDQPATGGGQHSASVQPDDGLVVIPNREGEGDHLDDDEFDELVTGEHLAMVGHDPEEYEDDEYDDGWQEEFTDDQFTDDHEVAVQPVAGSSAVTILGPMRPGRQAGEQNHDQGLLEPDPLEIVTLEDIEQARSGTRSGNRHG